MRTTLVFRPLVVALILAVLPLVGGCIGIAVTSLHPLYTEADLVTEPGIAGMWSDPDSKEEAWKFFAKPSVKAYTLIYSDEGCAARFDARFTRIGQSLYMDTVAQAVENEPKSSRLNNPLFCYHLIPGHNLWRVELKNDLLRLSLLDREMLEKGLQEKTVSVAHEKPEGDGDEDSGPAPVLTASTAELRAFILQSADKVFGEPIELHRRPAGTSAAALHAGKESTRR